MLTLERQNELREQYRRRNPGWRPATEVYADRVRTVIQPESRLLDLGCGRGGLLEQLHHPVSLTVGLDLDIQSLREHRLASGEHPLPRVAALNERLPFADEAFDIIIASWVLEHLQNPGACLMEIARVLRRGGSFIFITPNRRHPLMSLYALAGKAANFQGGVVKRLYGRDRVDTFPAYYRINSPAAISVLAQDIRLQVVHLETVADPTYLAIWPSMFALACRFESLLDKSRHIHMVGQLIRA